MGCLRRQWDVLGIAEGDEPVTSSGTWHVMLAAEVGKLRPTGILNICYDPFNVLSHQGSRAKETLPTRN